MENQDLFSSPSGFLIPQQKYIRSQSMGLPVYEIPYFIYLVFILPRSNNKNERYI